MSEQIDEVSSPVFGNVHQIPRLDSVTREEFLKNVYPKRMPVILSGLDIGPCCRKWTVDYLAETGGDKHVAVHVSQTPRLDFLTRNFVYRTFPFSELVRRASEEKHGDFKLSETEVYYMRAMGDDPRKEVADIRQHFPALAEDIVIPEFFPLDCFFSSVFRLSSPDLRLWTHYDVMDNLLIQVIGHKRVVMFSPQEVENLYLKGDKSQVLDVDFPDLDRFPRFARAQRYEGELQPGDVLFIPALWFHHMQSREFSVAVNVFWRHLEAELYDTKDPYGNRDLKPAARAMQSVDKALKTLEELPPVYRDFYARRLVSRIQEKAFLKEDMAGEQRQRLNSLGQAV